MRGSLVQRYKSSWSIVLDLGYQVDSVTGKKRRKQQWITVHGTKREAETRLAELVNDTNRGTFVAPRKRTFGEWLDEWVEKAAKPPAKAPSTYEHYLGVIDQHLKPKLGTIPLQALNAADLKRAYTEATRKRGKGAAALSPSTLAVHHVVAHPRSRRPCSGLVQRNVAKRSSASLAAAPIARTF
jgi:hypothetical protein